MLLQSSQQIVSHDPQMSHLAEYWDGIAHVWITHGFPIHEQNHEEHRPCLFSVPVRIAEGVTPWEPDEMAVQSDGALFDSSLEDSQSHAGLRAVQMEEMLRKFCRKDTDIPVLLKKCMEAKGRSALNEPLGKAFGNMVNVAKFFNTFFPAKTA